MSKTHKKKHAKSKSKGATRTNRTFAYPSAGFATAEEAIAHATLWATPRIAFDGTEYVLVINDTWVLGDILDEAGHFTLTVERSEERFDWKVPVGGDLVCGALLDNEWVTDLVTRSLWMEGKALREHGEGEEAQAWRSQRKALLGVLDYKSPEANEAAAFFDTGAPDDFVDLMLDSRDDAIRALGVDRVLKGGFNKALRKKAAAMVR